MADLVCYCLRVEKPQIVAAIEGGCSSIAGLTANLRVGSGCGGCLPDLEALVRFYGAKDGKDHKGHKDEKDDKGNSSETSKFVPYP